MPIVMTTRSTGVSSGLNVNMEIYYGLELGPPAPAQDRTYTVELSWATGDYQVGTIRGGGIADGDRVTWADRQIASGERETFGVDLTGSSSSPVVNTLTVAD